MPRTNFAPHVIAEVRPNIRDFSGELASRLEARYRHTSIARETVQRVLRDGLVHPLIRPDLADLMPRWTDQALREWPHWLRRTRTQSGAGTPSSTSEKPLHFPEFRNFYRVSVPVNHTAEDWAKTILELNLPGVARMFPDPRLELAQSSGYTCNTYRQDYRDKHPLGLSIDTVQLVDRFRRSRGEGEYFVDVETGWRMDHEQLDSYASDNPICGLSGFDIPHGTAVLGIVCGRKEAGSCSGIAPNIAGAGLSSYDFPLTRAEARTRRWLEYLESELANAVPAPTPPADRQVETDIEDTFTRNLWTALAAAIKYCRDRNLASGVILLEVTTEVLMDQSAYPVLVPIEIIPELRAILRMATLLDITVIEAAGNDRVDLDSCTDALGNHPLRRGPTYEFDSGAVIVGGQFERSNSGSRIDCVAQGGAIVAPDSDSTTDCRSDFGSTSGASAIIAGATLVLQGIHFEYKQSHLKPDELRRCLDSRQWPGEVAGGPARMPDLHAILRTHLQLAP